jgi:hypothetical protein
MEQPKRAGSPRIRKAPASKEVKGGPQRQTQMQRLGSNPSAAAVAGVQRNAAELQAPPTSPNERRDPEPHHGAADPTVNAYAQLRLRRGEAQGRGDGGRGSLTGPVTCMDCPTPPPLCVLEGGPPTPSLATSAAASAPQTKHKASIISWSAWATQSPFESAVDDPAVAAAARAGFGMLEVLRDRLRSNDAGQPFWRNASVEVWGFESAKRRVRGG